MSETYLYVYTKSWFGPTMVWLQNDRWNEIKKLDCYLVHVVLKLFVSTSYTYVFFVLSGSLLFRHNERNELMWWIFMFVYYNLSSVKLWDRGWWVFYLFLFFFSFYDHKFSYTIGTMTLMVVVGVVGVLINIGIL